MRSSISLWLFLIPFSSIVFSINVVPVSGKCLDDQKSLLLQFKASLKFHSSHSTKLVHWNPNDDCCKWKGIKCDNGGHIIGLDLSNESISGGIDDSSSLFSLRFLQNLTLADNNYVGAFPKKIFQVPSPTAIDLSGNKLMHGSLPEFPQNGALQLLDLTYTKFSGKLPDSIGNLRKLSIIYLRGCNFIGPLPGSLANLTELTYVDFAFNRFTGSIPSLRLSKNLASLDLKRNSITGEIPLSHFEGLSKLDYLNLGQNSLSGAIPDSLFLLPSLEGLYLNNNRFSGLIGEFKNLASQKLRFLDLSGNKLEGPIPEFVFKLKGLVNLALSENNFIGSIELSKFRILKDLMVLDLSRNKLSVSVRSSGSASSSLPQFDTLLLASCNIQEFPDLKNQSVGLWALDLSDNKISGEIPKWIWEVSHGSLISLNLSHNQFSTLQEPYNFPTFLDILDLHSNLLQGSIPKPPPQVSILDYSSNKLVGVIPQSIGNASHIKVLNFSHNALEGSIPPSIGNMKQLNSLDLSINKLSGNIPMQLANLTSLSSLNLSYNQLVGRIPQGSRFRAFTEKSFEGNKGLCGAPLKKRCNATAKAPASSLGDRKRSTYKKHVDRVLSEIQR